MRLDPARCETHPEECARLRIGAALLEGVNLPIRDRVARPQGPSAAEVARYRRAQLGAVVAEFGRSAAQARARMAALP